VGHFCPPESGSGSTDPIESGSNPDPDPQPWYEGIADEIRKGSNTYVDVLTELWEKTFKIYQLFITHSTSTSETKDRRS
jgi:hypothetical protein